MSEQGLAPKDRQVLEVIALAGISVTPCSVAADFDMTLEDAKECLHRLEERDLVERNGGHAFRASESGSNLVLRGPPKSLVSDLGYGQQSES